MTVILLKSFRRHSNKRLTTELQTQKRGIMLVTHDK